MHPDDQRPFTVNGSIRHDDGSTEEFSKIVWADSELAARRRAVADLRVARGPATWVQVAEVEELPAE